MTLFANFCFFIPLLFCCCNIILNNWQQSYLCMRLFEKAQTIQSPNKFIYIYAIFNILFNPYLLSEFKIYFCLLTLSVSLKVWFAKVCSLSCASEKCSTVFNMMKFTNNIITRFPVNYLNRYCYMWDFLSHNECLLLRYYYSRESMSHLISIIKLWCDVNW